MKDDKLIDAIIDLGTGMKDLRDEMKGMRKDMNLRFEKLETQQKETNHRLEKLDKQQAKTNMELSEIRLTFIQHSDSIEKVKHLEKRVYKLEQKNIH